jgi:hypothetical protein
MKPFSNIAIAVFVLVALAQLLRVALGWAVTVNGIIIPFWASLLACGIAATLAIMLWREKSK